MWDYRLYPQPKQVLDLAIPADMSWPTCMLVKADRPGLNPATCKSQVQRPTAEPPRKTCMVEMDITLLR